MSLIWFSLKGDVLVSGGYFLVSICLVLGNHFSMSEVFGVLCWLPMARLCEESCYLLFQSIHLALISLTLSSAIVLSYKIQALACNF
jgi:hypothetical protein